MGNEPVYFNEIEPYPAQWLRNLFPSALVDERGIKDVKREDVERRNRVHLFAGIGGWEYALSLAGWPPERSVWTGSCPCQPFSVAGRGKGIADERHLWPEMLRLITECKPPTVFGEQVASRLGREWLSTVFTDLEALGYAVAGADLCAAGVGAPHIRQRLWWVAHAERWAAERHGYQLAEAAGGVQGATPERERIWHDVGDGGAVNGVAYSNGQRSIREHTFWSPSDFVWCRDGKWRPVEPGTFPLAHGILARVGRLRAYGNAIVPQVAAAFVRVFLEAEQEA